VYYLTNTPPSTDRRPLSSGLRLARFVHGPGAETPHALEPPRTPSEPFDPPTLYQRRSPSELWPPARFSLFQRGETEVSGAGDSGSDGRSAGGPSTALGPCVAKGSAPVRGLGSGVTPPFHIGLNGKALAHAKKQAPSLSCIN